MAGFVSQTSCVRGFGTKFLTGDFVLIMDDR